MKPFKLRKAFYNKSTLQVARDLLGKILVYNCNGMKLGGKLVEVEAYIGEDDPACHAYRGKTPRNEIMYGDAGFLYVYFTYGNHNMLNIVTEKKGFPAAVLLRGLEPVCGIETMSQNRGGKGLTEISNGPGKLAEALGITVTQKGLDVTGDIIYVVDDKFDAGEIWHSSRIGIGNNGADKLWRFYIKDNPHVSKAAKFIRNTAKPFNGKD